MRKVTINTINALMNRCEIKQGNTKVEKDSSTGFYTLKLHNNPIAYIDGKGSLWITHAGWDTVTTKERLNGLPNVSIQQNDFVWYLNGKEWDGRWTEIGKV